MLDQPPTTRKNASGAEVAYATEAPVQAGYDNAKDGKDVEPAMDASQAGGIQRMPELASAGLPPVHPEEAAGRRHGVPIDDGGPRRASQKESKSALPKDDLPVPATVSAAAAPRDFVGWFPGSIKKNWNANPSLRAVAGRKDRKGNSSFKLLIFMNFLSCRAVQAVALEAHRERGDARVRALVSR